MIASTLCRFLSLLLIFSVFSAICKADEASQQIYSNAVQAITSNDCNRAITLFEKYKVLEKTRLAQHPDFSKKIDEQIFLCKQQADEKLTVFEPRVGTRINGMEAGSEVRSYRDLSNRIGF